MNGESRLIADIIPAVIGHNLNISRQPVVTDVMLRNMFIRTVSQERQRTCIGHRSLARIIMSLSGGHPLVNGMSCREVHGIIPGLNFLDCNPTPLMSGG